MGNQDSTLAALTPGELVVPRTHAPSVANHLKAAGVPGFASGGIVGSEGAGVGNIIPFGVSSDTSWAQATGKAFAAALTSAVKTQMTAVGAGGKYTGPA